MNDIGCTTYKPGDPGFEEIAGQVTPLHKIRKGLSHSKTNGITADCSPMPKARRHESTDKLRG